MTRHRTIGKTLKHRRRKPTVRKTRKTRTTIRKGKRRYVRMRAVDHTINLTIKDSVAFFGCWGVGCQKGSGQWYLAKDIDANSKIEAMITAGDNFYTKKLSTGEDKEAFFNRNVEMCYTKDMYASLGNHDIEKEIYSIQKNHGNKNPRWILPAKNYVININHDIRVVMINTNPIYEEKAYKEQEGGDELLQDDMNELTEFINNLPPSSDRMTIVVGHHPFLTNRHKVSAKKRVIDKDLVRKIIALSDLYICADEHNLQHIVKDDLNEFILGGGGGDPDRNIILDYPEETKFQYGYHGYGIFNVKSKKMSLRILDSETNEMKDSGYVYPVQKKNY